LQLLSLPSPQTSSPGGSQVPQALVTPSSVSPSQSLSSPSQISADGVRRVAAVVGLAVAVLVLAVAAHLHPGQHLAAQALQV
jgi:hypothetical protein